MKKILSFVLCLALLLAACGNKNEASSSKSDSKERTFTTESGDKVKIPKNPNRFEPPTPFSRGARGGLGSASWEFFLGCQAREAHTLTLLLGGAN